MKKTGLILCTTLLLSGAAALAGYQVEAQIGKGQLGQISQIAIGVDDTLCVLEKNGTVSIFNPDGSLASTIDTGMQNTDAIATAPSGEIHVFSTLTKTKKVKVGARMRTVHIPIGVEWSVFDPSGEKLKTMKLDNLKSARAARIVGDKLRQTGGGRPDGAHADPHGCGNGERDRAY